MKGISMEQDMVEKESGSNIDRTLQVKHYLNEYREGK